MKKIILALSGFFMALAAIAQYGSTVTINVKGTKNKEVWIDGKNYTTTNVTGAAGNYVITLDNLATGQHSLQILRANNNSAATTRSNSNFYLRDGYDMRVTVNANGSVQLREVRKRDVAGTYRTPITDYDFNQLYENITSKSRATDRLTAVTNAFTTSGNFFTTAQVRQLIQLISSQNNRLQLAKNSYAVITDPANFTQVYDLLTTQSRKNELTTYVNNYIATHPGHTTSTGMATHNQGRSPMSSTEFNTIYETAIGHQYENLRMNYITNVFATSTNYFTTNQARQLIQLMNNEPDKLILAKTSYRGITDAVNFPQLYAVFNSQASRNDLVAYVNDYNYSSNTNTAGNIYRTPMSATAFTTLYKSVQNEWGLGAKMSKLTNIFNTSSYYFSTTQAKQLIQLVSAESNRLQLSKLAYNRITDPANFTLLYDILASQSSRDELQAYVNNSYYSSTASNSGYVAPMSDASFNSLYNQVQNQWGLGVKMNALVDIFANTSYYFTTAQASKLIQLVSAESNRLQLAKAAFDRITDRSNFTQLYDVLSSQASKDELQAYINNRM